MSSMSEGDRLLVALETVPDDLILICGRGPFRPTARLFCGRGPSGRLPDSFCGRGPAGRLPDSFCGRGPSGRLPDGLAEKFGSPGSRPHGVEFVGTRFGKRGRKGRIGRRMKTWRFQSDPNCSAACGGTRCPNVPWETFDAGDRGKKS